MISETALRRAYPRYGEDPARYTGRIDRVAKGFEASFGGASPRIFTAPGRTEVGGNHTDHQRGCVLAAAIDVDMLCAAAPNGRAEIRVLSEGYPVFAVDLSGLSPREEERNTSAAIVRGIAARFTQLGYRVGGFDAYMVSDVLPGSGLSSSAAFEVLMGSVINGLFAGGAVSPVAIAQIGQYAENAYFGKGSGLEDQMASSVGGFAAIDFKDPANPVIERVEYDLAASGHALCIIDSRASHAGLSSEYDTMPNEMRAVARCLGKEYLREAEYGEFIRALPAIRAKAGDRAVLRALHFFRENLRAQEEAKLLKAGDFQGFLKVLRESGRSSYMYLQNVTVPGAVREQAVAYVLAVCDMLLGERGGFRVHGGGLAGTVQAFVPEDMLEYFISEAGRLVGEGCCRVTSVRQMGGGELV